MQIKIISGLVLVSALLTVFFEYFNRQFVWLFKPLTMILVIALVWRFGTRRFFYLWAVLVGLIFSLIGDVFLIVPEKFFVWGLLSFLFAHIFYCVAFLKAGAGKFNPLSLIAFVVGGIILKLNYAGVPEALKIPVIVYAAAISLMLSFALNFYLTQKSPKALFALSGAFLFVVSDSILAFNKFTYQFLTAKIFILSTYFLAQWLIARSTFNEESPNIRSADF